MMATTPSHLVLARKWRPERFAELVGQEAVTRTLAQALMSGRIAHAFLFTGIRGVGKTTAARILARCLNCERGPAPEPCGECPACVEIRQGRALDVVEIDGATYRKIDDARSIIENLSYRPARDRFKIYIIDEAHQLTDQAFNALLKTLEEPPPHVKFILATTEPQKMPETILSRLQRYDFRRIPFATILERLRELARREGAAIEDGALALLAREAGGSMRDAERMLETALALADGPISEAAVADSLGVASRSHLYTLTEAILERDPAKALLSIRELHGKGANLATAGRDLLETLRNLVIAKLPQQGGLSALAALPDHEVQNLRRLAEKPSLRDLMRLFRLMAQAQEEILRSAYADMLIEMAVVRMATLAPVLDGEELARALKALGDDGNGGGTAGGGGPSNPSARSHTAEKHPGGERLETATARRLPVAGEVKANAPLRAQVGKEPTSSALRQSGSGVPDFREHIRSRKAALAGFMEHGAGLELDGDTLRIIPSSEIYVRYLADNRSAIAELASEFYGRRIAVEMTTVAAGDSEPRPVPAVASATPGEDRSGASADAVTTAAVRAETNDGPPQDRESIRRELFADPVVRKILDEFEGRLVDVRHTAARHKQS